MSLTPSGICSPARKQELLAVAPRLEEAYHLMKATGDDSKALLVEKEIMALTEDLRLHPDFWDYCCFCDQCK